MSLTATGLAFSQGAMGCFFLDWAGPKSTVRGVGRVRTRSLETGASEKEREAEREGEDGI